MGAIVAETIHKPLFTNTTFRIDIVVWSDDERSTRYDLTAKTVEAYIDDGANTRKYTATLDDADEGEAHVDGNASYHGTAGDVDCQIHIEGIPKGEFTLTFRDKMAEV